MKLLLKNLLFTLLIPGTVGVYLPLWLGRRSDGLHGWWTWLGLPLIGLGLTILLICIWDFMTKGEGTPFPLDPPKKLVTAQLYSYSRNPMYLGIMTMLAGWSVWYASIPVIAYSMAIVLIFNLFVRIIEEPLLEKQFGQAYEEYCRKVPRWL
ncbi:MAG: hypothetical protein EPGJADBJ_03222 [Saprospiraceae bacterium]|nr:hypothetical protein [Saprospiraceae bacterium]